MLRFRRIGLTVKSDLSGKDSVVGRVLDILKQEGASVCVDTLRLKGVRCARGMKSLSRSPLDLLLVIGGDGTIFRAIREIRLDRIPILGINRGAVGFLAEIDADEIESALPPLLSGEGAIEERRLLSVEVHRGRSIPFRGRAVNEAVIAQGAIARLLHLQTTVSGEPLTTYHADGLIIATPTGSTAYSLSAGGPIVHPRLPALILTPINPHSFTQKPIVLPGGNIISVEVIRRTRTAKNDDVSLTLDGQVYERLRSGDRVVVGTDAQTIPFLRRRQDTFLRTLRTKLHWGETI